MPVMDLTLRGERWRAESGMKYKFPIRLVSLFFAIGLASGYVGAQVPSLSPQDADPKARLAKAEAMFAERCKKSGEFIHRTVEDVEGVFLVKIRPEKSFDTEQFALYDPYGNDSGGDRYIRSFLIGRRAGGSLTDRPEEIASRGYRYVEAVDPADDKRYRYTGSMKVVGKKNSNATNVKLNLQRDPNYDLNIYAFILDKILAPGASLRYGVTYEDISTRDEREFWIAGSSLKVIDLNTNEVIAERIGYLMDRGQGSRAGFRSPWLLAASNACPSFFPKGQRVSVPGTVYQNGQTRNFVEKVLKPKGTE